MKKLIKYLTFSVVLSGILFSTSCKKDSTTPDCQLISLISESSGISDTTLYSYNNDRKILSAVNGPNHVVYSYFGQTAIRLSTYGSSTGRDSIIYGSNSLIKEIYQFNPSGNLTTKQIYTYNGSNELTQVTETSYPSMAVKITNVTYANGDPVTISDGVNSTTLEYYTDKPAAKGDYLDVFQLSNFGGAYLKPKHLQKSIQSGSTLINFSYDLDANGNVTKLTYTSGSTITVYNLAYNCN